MSNFNAKLLSLSHMMNEEYQKLLNKNELLIDRQWFGEEHERIFSFQQEVIKRLKPA